MLRRRHQKITQLIRGIMFYCPRQTEAGIGTSRIIQLVLMLSLCAGLASCNVRSGSKAAYVDPDFGVVTGDIQAGIQKHIDEQVRLGEGYFKLPFKDKQLRLKLVRIHLEYLATLGPQHHFACVDLAGADGEFYDVDFFLQGDPGSMTVTETIVHKINGKPLYLWEQQPDKTWGRVSVTNASEQLLGIITGRDEFDFVYRATLPQLTDNAQAWIPLPTSDAFQSIRIDSIDTPTKHKVLNESTHGNSVIHMDLSPADSGKTIEMRFHVVRLEKAAYKEDLPDASMHLKEERLVPITDKIRTEAEKAVTGKKGDLVRARALYDTVIDQMRYIKNSEKGWGKGDAAYACDSLYGNCTDFHAYFIGLARAVGIPARFAIGAAVPSARNDGGVDGYHCWAEFYAEGKWWPVDISEGDKFTGLSMYYFGHHPANRVEFSRGRDLVVEPGPSTGPINFLAYPVLEIAGEPAKTKIAFSFQRQSKCN
jgi:hypothetical protein